MDVGIGLPNAVPGTTGADLLEWARRAERRGFSTLGTIDRIVYSNYEPLTALTAAAAVTERIGLCSSVLLGPLRPNAAELAKRALSIHAISGGRLTLGVGIGGREDDYEASEIEFAGRGRRLDALLARLREIWDRDDIGPKAMGTPTLILGGHADASFARAARFGDGWIAGGSAPGEYSGMLEKLNAAWVEAGREDRPKTKALAYFSLGEGGAENARTYLTDYYAWLGEEVAGQIAASAAQDAETVGAYVSAFAGAGCDELIVFPSSSDSDQVDLLADAVGL